MHGDAGKDSPKWSIVPNKLSISLSAGSGEGRDWEDVDRRWTLSANSPKNNHNTFPCS